MSSLYIRLVQPSTENPVARRVKTADLRDNLDATRLHERTERDRLRRNRYLTALRELEV